MERFYNTESGDYAGKCVYKWAAHAYNTFILRDNYGARIFCGMSEQKW